MYITNAVTLTITDTSFESNTAGGSGGGLAARSITELVSLVNSSFISNAGNDSSAHGGGLLLANIEEVDATGLTINGNTVGRNGGGVYCHQVTVSHWRSIQAAENRAGKHGGAMYAQWGTSLVTYQFNATHNKAMGGSGGAMATYYFTYTTLQYLTLFNNEASEWGGGIIQSSVEGTYIFHSRIVRNTAGSSGGGVRFTHPSGFGLYHIHTSEIIGNIAYGSSSGGNGGGVSVSSVNFMELDTVKLQNNEARASYGGAMAVEGCVSLYVWSTDVIDNTAASNGGGFMLKNTGMHVESMRGSHVHDWAFDNVFDGNQAEAGGAMSFGRTNRFYTVNAFYDGRMLLYNNQANYGSVLYAVEYGLHNRSIYQSEVINNTALGGGTFFFLLHTDAVSNLSQREEPLTIDTYSTTIKGNIARFGTLVASQMIAFEGPSVYHAVPNGNDFATPIVFSAFQDFFNQTFPDDSFRLASPISSITALLALYLYRQKIRIQTLSAILVYVRQSYPKIISKVKVILATFQIVANIPVTLQIQLPLIFMRYLTTLEVFNLNFGVMFPFACAISLDYMQFLLLVTLLPIGLSVASSGFESNQAPNGFGGALMVRYGTSVGLDMNRFYINTAGSDGGSVYVSHINTTVAAVNSIFFQDGSSSRGGGLFASDIGTAEIVKCQFLENTASTDGGAMYTANAATLTITDTSFESNRAGGSGGGLAAQSITELVSLVNSSYVSNVGETGGGLFLSIIDVLDVTELTINGNTANSNGGGVYCDKVMTSHWRSIQAAENQAGTEGGALFAQNGESLDMYQFNATHNKAIDGSGGAIATYFYSYTTLEHLTLFNNEASEWGGGIMQSSIEGTYIGQSRIILNTAGSSGGGVRFTHPSSGGLFRIHTSEIIGNIAYGSSSGGNGGGVSVFAVNSLELNTVKLQNNEALAAYGGAMAVEGCNTLNVLSTEVVENTAATHGGGFLLKNTILATLKTVLFEGNRANSGDGGALYCFYDQGYTQFVDWTFIRALRNVAAGSGGGIYLTNVNMLAVSSWYVMGNVASTGDGGGIYLTKMPYHTSLKDLNVTDNNAVKGHGGGIAYISAPLANNIWERNYIHANIAGRSGGGLYVQELGLLYLIQMTLVGNQGTDYGGGMYIDALRAFLVDEMTIRANVASMGGGMHVASLSRSGALEWSYDNVFDGNRAEAGGAMSFGRTNRFYTVNTQHNSSVSFYNNQANYGSVLYAVEYGLHNRTFHQSEVINNTALGGGTFFFLLHTDVVSNRTQWQAVNPSLPWPEPFTIDPLTTTIKGNTAKFGTLVASQMIAFEGPSVYHAVPNGNDFATPIVFSAFQDFFNQTFPDDSFRLANPITAYECSGVIPSISTTGSDGEFRQGTVSFQRTSIGCAQGGFVNVQFTVAYDLNIVPAALSRNEPTLVSSGVHTATMTTQIRYRTCLRGERVVGTRCTPCGNGEYSFRNDSEVCEPCTYINGIRSCRQQHLNLKPGYWRYDEDTFAVIPCWSREACVGGEASGTSLCRTGYEGPACGVCSAGYFSNGRKCKRCDGRSELTGGILLLIALTVSITALLALYLYRQKIRIQTLSAILVYVRQSYPKIISKVKVILATFQIVANIPVTLQIQLPLIFMRYLTTLEVFNLNFGVMFPFAFFNCTDIDPYKENPELSSSRFMTADMRISCDSAYYLSWIPYTIAMIVVYPIGIPLTYFLVLYAHREEISTRDVVAEEEREVWLYQQLFSKPTPTPIEAADSSVAAAVEANDSDDGDVNPRQEKELAGYSGSDSVVTKPLSPEGDVEAALHALTEDPETPTPAPLSEDSSHTEDDLDLVCLQYLPPSPHPPQEYTGNSHTNGNEENFGEPLWTGCATNLSPEVTGLDFLWSAYEPRFWYWEVIETIRRIILTAVIAIISPGTSLQSILAILFAIFFLQLYGVFAPYEDEEDDTLANIGQIQVFLTFFAALIVQNQLVSETWFNLLGILMIVINVVMYAMPFVFLARRLESMARIYRRQQELMSKMDAMGLDKDVDEDNNSDSGSGGGVVGVLSKGVVSAQADAGPQEASDPSSHPSHDVIGVATSTVREQDVEEKAADSGDHRTPPLPPLPTPSTASLSRSHSARPTTEVAPPNKRTQLHRYRSEMSLRLAMEMERTSTYHAHHKQRYRHHPDEPSPQFPWSPAAMRAFHAMQSLVSESPMKPVDSGTTPLSRQSSARRTPAPPTRQWSTDSLQPSTAAAAPVVASASAHAAPARGVPRSQSTSSSS
eukprot:gene1001-722_t